MRIAVLGTGTVGRALATAWAGAGHDVVMGSRSAHNAAATAWVAEVGGSASHATFAEAAQGADVVVNATAGAASAAAVGSIDPADLVGVVVLDAANALDFSSGGPPALAIPDGETSVAEQLQRMHPDAHVVKALNTVNVSVMVDPGGLGDAHHLPIAGDDAAAKDVVRGLLGDLGWRDEQVLDLGDLTAARGMEHYLLLWLSLAQALGTPRLNLAIRR